jgi:predicted DNA-binding transcriptional regulator YafY
MNRIDRISAILIQLQSRRVVKAQDIAERFSISLRTVYRDIKSLEESGIPLIGEAGVGYSLADGYRLPPVMFTKDEATAFLTAEKLIEKLTDNATSDNYKSAMYKIRAVLRSGEKDFLENIDGHIEVLKSRSNLNSPPVVNVIPLILKGINEKKVLKMNYFSHYRQEDTDRCVEPVGVFYLDNYWHLIAFCRMRNDYRNFRMDRISNLALTDQFFGQQHPPLKQYLDNLYKDRDLKEVVIHVEVKCHAFLESQKYYNGFISERKVGDKIEMHFLAASIEGFARWFIMFGDKAAIIKPQELKDRVKEIAAGISCKL